MKKTLFTFGFLWLAVILSAQIDVLEKRINFSCKNKPLKEALDKLKKKTGLRLSYADQSLQNKHVTLKVRHQKVGYILNRLLRQAALQYESNGSQIVITSQKSPPRIYQKYTITGTVKDDETGITLPLTNILIANQKPRVANKDGEIYLRLRPADSLGISFVYPGYEAQTMTLRIHRDTFLSIRLNTDNELLPEVIVQGAKRRMIPAEQEATATVSDIATLVDISERADIVKSIQQLPGVQSGNEGFAGLYIRGGSTDQNLVLLDGAPIYNATHLAGVFSIFNEAVIGDIALYKNELPARYGGRLSSVLDVQVREGNMNRHSVQGNVGLLTSGLLIEGPIQQEKTSFLFAVRRTSLDMLVRPLSRRWFKTTTLKLDSTQTTNGEIRYAFYDLNAKITHRFSKKDRLSLNVYTGGDSFAFNNNYLEETADIREENSRSLSSLWGNFTASLKWTHIFQQKMILHTSATFTEFEFDYYDKYAFINMTGDATTGARLIQNYTSDIQDITFKTELKYTPSNKHRFRFGAQAIQHRFRPGINFATEENIDNLEQIDTTFNNPLSKTWELSGYFQSRHALGNLRLHTGIRSGFFLIDNKLFTIFEPRIALNVRLTNKFTLRTTHSYTTQHLHLLTNSGIELPTDLWVPATPDAPPERSWQTGAGIVWSNDNYTLSLDAYYKRMNRLIAFQGEDAIVLSGRNWQEKITSGRGWAYGLELALVKKMGQTKGILGYTLSWSYRQFDNVNKGLPYPFKYDRRHDISAALKHDLTKRVSLITDWTYGSGNPFTRPIREAPVLDPIFPSGSPATVYIYEDKNKSRMPASHRLNIGAEWRGIQKQRYSWTLDFGVYNVYNRKNPFLLYIGNKENTEENEYKQISLFPILPYINYKFKF